MKKRIMAFYAAVIIVLVCCAGCAKKDSSSQPDMTALETDGNVSGNANSVVNESNVNSGEEQKSGKYVQTEMKGEITISTMYNMEFLTTAAENFMRKYPDVKVTVNESIELSDSDVNGADKMEQYRTGLNTKIMSGKAEDIIFTQQLPIKKYMDMGAFEDLSSYIETDPDINNENYFMNVIESARDKDGHLYIVPYKANFEVISFEKELLSGEDYFKGKDSLRFSEAIEYAKQKMEQTNKKNTYLTLLGRDGYVYSLVRENFNSLIDYNGKKANIASSKYVEWLKNAKEFDNKGYFNPPGLDFYNTKYYFVLNSDFDVQAAFYNLSPGGNCQGKPVADSEGNVYTSSSNFIGISSSSKNKEIAWEFIKYVLSDEIQSHPSLSTVGTAVNRKGFNTLVERCLKFYTDGTNQQISFDDYKNLLEQWVNQINKCDLYDPTITDYFGEEQKKFFDGKQTAEQTVNNLQNKITQYLKE